MTERIVSSQLNVGCGHDIREGWVNLDRFALPGVDIVHDLRELPYPFEDGRFSSIDCQDVLEHLDLVATLRELHRILRPGGRLKIRSPHFTSFLFWADPTHQRAFSVLTLPFFVRDHSLDRGYYFDFEFDGLEDVNITFQASGRQPWNRLVGWVVNRSERSQYLYEATAACRLFPAVNIEAVLVR